MLLMPRTMRRISVAAVLAALIMPLSFIGPAPAPAAAAAPESASVTVEAVCPPAAPGYAQCLALRRTDIAAQPNLGMSPLLASPPYGPADIQSAYALPGGSAGSGLTVAIVDAFDAPTAEADLAFYRSQFGLPPCTTANGCFRKVNQRGVAGSYPPFNAGWAQEIALDIQMVSAACPSCNILLVEADSNSTDALGASVNTAVAMGAIAVSNSYSAPEWAGETAADAAYFNHPGVAITAATGDCGYHCTGGNGGPFFDDVGYPAASQYVVAVGGTRLVSDGSARGWTESAWGVTGIHEGGTGSGCSAYEPKPSWQLDTGCAKRTQADVSAVADPATGVSVRYNGDWYTFGGTSASSPIIASVYALAGGPLAGTYPASYPYGAVTGLNDVIGGNNDVHWGSCTVAYLCNGVADYDGPTGLGTPNGTAAFMVPPPPATYYPMAAPGRLLDTRSGNGLSVKLTAGVPGTFKVTGRSDIVIPAAATAVTGNVTVVNSSNSWAVFLGPNPTPAPTTSTINFARGEVTGNGLTVALGSGGYLSATYISSPGNTTDLVFDVTGYFMPDTSGARYHPMTPVRLLDTRSGNGLSGKLLANTPAPFQVAGRGGVDATATAVTGNVTVVNSTNGWAVFLGPHDTPFPTTSTINFTSGQIKGNSLTVALSETGSLSATYMSTAGNTTDLVFDVTGYYTTGSGGSRFVPLKPVRLLDTRYGNGLSGKLLANTPAPFGIRSRGGVSAEAEAITGNVTVVNESNGWAVFVGPISTPNPTTSTVNFNRGDIKGNGLTVALSPSGGLYATYISTAGNTTDLVLDVTGYFVP